MTRTVALTALLSTPLFAQAAENPKFDIADVHSSPHITQPFMRGGVLRGTRYDIRFATMVDLITTAYKVDSDKVQGGPA